MCHKLTAALARKRPSPLARGRLEIWAGAIVHTVGGVNFVYDRSQTPYISFEVLCDAFGAANSTVGNKASQIRQLLKISNFDPDWTVPSMLDQNPLIWMLSVNGFLVDIRTMPLEVQQITFDKGLIPYIPALKNQRDDSGGLDI